MEVMQFKRNYEIICKAYKGDCAMCPLSNYCSMLDEGLYISKVTPELVKIVKNIVENVLFSRQQLFLQQYPNAEMMPDGVLVISPCVIDPSQRQSSLCTNHECKVCRERFWSELVISPNARAEEGGK